MSLVLARTTRVVVPMATGRVVVAMEAVAVAMVAVEAAAAPVVASSGDISQPDGLN